MSQPASSTTSENLKQAKKLEIVRFISDPHSKEEAAMPFDVDTMAVKRIVDTRTRLEKVCNLSIKRVNLEFGEKITVLHLLDSGKNGAHAAEKYSVQQRTVRRICEKRDKLLEFEADGSPIGFSKPLRAKYPDIYRDVLCFLRFVRSERLPVTLSLIRTCVYGT